MRRISPRTVLIVTSGTAGNRNAERNAAITFCRRKGRIASAEKMGCLEIVRSALMDSTPPCIGYCLQKILLDLRQCRQK